MLQNSKFESLLLIYSRKLFLFLTYFLLLIRKLFERNCILSMNLILKYVIQSFKCQLCILNYK